MVLNETVREVLNDRLTKVRDWRERQMRSRDEIRLDLAREEDAIVRTEKAIRELTEALDPETEDAD